jgi:hypothetical protein
LRRVSISKLARKFIPTLPWCKVYLRYISSPFRLEQNAITLKFTEVFLSFLFSRTLFRKQSRKDPKIGASRKEAIYSAE